MPTFTPNYNFAKPVPMDPVDKDVWGGLTNGNWDLLDTILFGKAPLASPVFTGVPVGPTAALGTNTTQLATTAFVKAAGDLKANLASPTFTGVPAGPTASAGTNTTQFATTAFVTGAIATSDAAQASALALKANLASPTFTGVPAGPTAAPGTNTTQFATTAFVAAAVSGITGFTSVAVTIVSTSGAGSYVKPAGLKYVEVWCVGGGGGACTVFATGATQSSVSGGGGGGGVCMKIYAAGSLAASTPYSVGAGGNAGTAGGGGLAGGDTTFLGQTGNGGNGSAPSSAAGGTVNYPSGGAGGTASGGTINVDGMDGGQATRAADGSAVLGRSGTGGGNVFAASRPGVATGAAFAGGPGNFPGGGARGAANGQNQAATIGANGSVGMIMFREYF